MYVVCNLQRTFVNVHISPEDIVKILSTFLRFTLTILSTAPDNSGIARVELIACPVYHSP